MLDFRFNFECGGETGVCWCIRPTAFLSKRLGLKVGNPEYQRLQEYPGFIHDKLDIRCVGNNFGLYHWMELQHLIVLPYRRYKSGNEVSLKPRGPSSTGLKPRS